MKKSWSLPVLLDGLHQGVEKRLDLARALFQHPVMKGDASETVWLEFLRQYLPRRYEVSRAVVVDSRGTFSHSIDIVIHDRQYTPFILQHENQTILPAESVYAVFEAKQVISKSTLTYAGGKTESVRKLHRTNEPITQASGNFPVRPLKPIIAGILALSGSAHPFGAAFHKQIGELVGERQLDLGCVATKGMFSRNAQGHYEVYSGANPTTAFLFELVARLQDLGTVPAINMRAYANWLK